MKSQKHRTGLDETTSYQTELGKATSNNLEKIDSKNVNVNYVTRQITVAKCTETELGEVQSYLHDLEEVVNDNECYGTDDYLANKAIADVAREYPKRTFIVPLNLWILLDNYQDSDSDILQHPKWMTDMITVLEEIDKQLSDNQENAIKSGSELHVRIRECLMIEK